MRKGKGFTLIELLVVISIIALLMAILIPSLRKARLQVKYIVCASNQKQILIGLNTYATDNDLKLPPSLLEQDSLHPPNLLTISDVSLGSSVTIRNSVGKALRNYLPVAQIFMCPASPHKVGGKFYFTDPPCTLQKHYMTNDPAYLGWVQSSYSLLWNYSHWEDQVFRPLSKGKHKLMITDVMYVYHGGSTGLVFTDWWLFAHRAKGMHKRTVGVMPGGNSQNFAWLGYDFNGPFDVPQNAGYLDGHVERTRTKTWKKIGYNNSYTQYIPKDWK